MSKIFNKFNLFINIYISLIINIILSIVLPLVMIGMINFPIFIKGFLIAFVVSTLLVLFIPLNKLGDKIAGGIGLKPMSAGFKCVSTLVLSLILSLIMSALMVRLNVPAPAFVPAWKHAFPFVLGSVYISALFGTFTAFPLAVKVLGPPPGMPH